MEPQLFPTVLPIASFLLLSLRIQNKTFTSQMTLPLFFRFGEGTRVHILMVPAYRHACVNYFPLIPATRVQVKSSHTI